MITRPLLQYPAKPKRGDRIAIVSPSSGLPGLFPVPYELGLQRLREELGLVPVEYPTTRRMDADPKDRAADLHAAFADPSIAAIISTIGGDDQIRVLPHLDRALIAAHPKPFFGYSDNTKPAVHRQAEVVVADRLAEHLLAVLVSSAANPRLAEGRIL